MEHPSDTSGHTIWCPKCDFENREGRRFCSNCGAALSSVCPACGFVNEPEEKFCGGCGVALAAAETSAAPSAPGEDTAAAPSDPERRQVTILFSDLSGFTALSQSREPEEVQRIVSRHFEVVDGIVTDFGGTIDKHIGDAVMALFGAPVAHGNDPERAVRAALAIQDAMASRGPDVDEPLEVHIGIASGQVVASRVGSDIHREYTVTGESVNLAARLVELAASGETLISDAVHRAIDGLVDVEEVRDVSIKGVDRPIKVWRLQGLRDARAPGHDRPLVGRRAELAQFRGVLESCRETGLGQAIYVRGEAGIGKTRLVEEFATIAAEVGFETHFGLVLDFGVGRGQDAIRSIVRALLSVPPTGNERIRRVAADSAVSTRLFEPDQLVFAHDLLDVPQSAEQRALYDAMDNDVRNRGKQKLVATLIKRISRNRPLFILVEDIHSAGRLTLDHLARMTATVGQCPAILVMTSRTEGDPLDRTWRLATGQTAMMTIDVAPLREEEALVLADGFMDATHQFARNCVERAEGNPLFLEQLLRSALAKEDEEVPGSVQSIVLARVDRLSPRDKRALQVAAVLGQRFSIETARYLLDEGDYDCAALIDQNLVRATDEDYLFAHALIWESVYQSLVTDRKRELHMRAAKWFSDRDPMLRAEHLDRAGDATAARAYLEAAQVQTKLYHFERALRLLERGAEIARNPADRFDLLATQGMCLRDIGRPAESISVYRQALKVAETNVARSHALIGLAAGMRVTDEFDEALSALDEAEALTRDDPKLLRERSEVHYYRGNLYFPLGRLSGCLEEHKLALDLALEAHCPECEARALSGLGDAYYSQGRMKKALDYFKRCVDLSRHNGFGRIEVSNQYMIAWNRLYMAEVPGSVEDAREAIKAAERVAHRRALMVAELAAGRTLIEYGSPAEAARHIDRGLALVENLGASRFKPFFLIFLARVRLAEGGYRPETVALMEEALDVSHRTGFGFLGPWVLSTLALVSDDRARQTKALEEGKQALAGDCVGHNYYAFYQDAMEVAARNSHWDEVDRYAGALDDYARTEPLPLSDFLVARGRALARDGRGDAESLSELQRLEDDARSAGLIRMARDLERVLAERA